MKCSTSDSFLLIMSLVQWRRMQPFTSWSDPFWTIWTRFHTLWNWQTGPIKMSWTPWIWIHIIFDWCNISLKEHYILYHSNMWTQISTLPKFWHKMIHYFAIFFLQIVQELWIKIQDIKQNCKKIAKWHNDKILNRYFVWFWSKIFFFGSNYRF